MATGEFVDVYCAPRSILPPSHLPSTAYIWNIKHQRNWQWPGHALFGHNPSQSITILDLCDDSPSLPPPDTFSSIAKLVSPQKDCVAWSLLAASAPSRSQDGSNLGATVQLPPPQPSATDHFARRPTWLKSWLEVLETSSHHFIILSISRSQGCHQEQLDTSFSRYQDIYTKHRTCWPTVTFKSFSL